MMTRNQKSRSKGVPSGKNLAPVVIFVILNSLGFPGKFGQVFGESIGTVTEYASFALQIGTMLFSSGEDAMEYRLVDLKAKYGALYAMTAVFFALSMFGSREPAAQFVTCARFSVTVFFALWIVDRYAPEEILHLICSAQAIFIAFTAVFMVLFPNMAFVHEVGDNDFTGLLQTKNNAAAELSCCILLQLALFHIRRGEKKAVSSRFVLLLVVQTVLLFLCNATGAFFCALIPAVYLLFFEKRMGEERRLSLGIVYVTASVGFVVLALSILPVFSPFFEAIGKDATLTGRVPLWQQIVRVMTEHNTMTGYGFGMFWRDRSAVALVHSAFSRNSFMGSMTTGAHNVILELWLNVGLIGVGAYFAAMVAVTSRIRQLSEPGYILCAAYILWFLLFGLTERAFSPYQYQTLFLMIAMGAACEKKPLPARRGGRKEDAKTTED